MIDRGEDADSAQRDGERGKAWREPHGSGRDASAEEVDRNHVAAAPVIRDPAER